MHSSKLRGNDFQIKWNNHPVTHAAFFENSQKTDRLGVFAPSGYEGAGAITLIMAFVTAFYDAYRAETDSFFAYPDFFTFQRQTPVANYSMFDIWPHHKNVHVSSNANETAAAITDRGINILLVPRGSQQTHTFEKVQIAAIHRNIRRCFRYDPTGQVSNPNLEITSSHHAFSDWVLSMFKTCPDSAHQQAQMTCWQNAPTLLHQTFCEIDIETAMQYL